jgi:hypothetical protein
MNLLAHIGNKRPGPWLAQQAQQGKALDLGSDEARAAYWRAFEAEREKLYGPMTKRVRAQFKDEMRDAWAIGGNPDIVGYWQSANQHGERWKALLTEINEKVGSVFAERTMDQISGKAAGLVLQRKAVDDVWLEALMDYIAKTVGEKVAAILATTKELIRAAIREGIANGEGVYEVSQRIERLYLEEIIPRRSEVIARTEVVHASGAGSRAAAKASGLKLNHTWLTTLDGRQRETHDAANGQTKPLDEPFDVGGSLLMFPGDSSLGADAAELIQCRCVETYAVVR